MFKECEKEMVEVKSMDDVVIAQELRYASARQCIQHIKAPQAHQKVESIKEAHNPTKYAAHDILNTMTKTVNSNILLKGLDVAKQQVMPMKSTLSALSSFVSWRIIQN